MRKYFGTDGIRRIANTELTPDLVFRVAKAGAHVLAKHSNHVPTILIGRDTRISGTLIESAMIAGFLSYYYSYKKIVTKKYRSNCTLFSILSIVILFGSFILFTLVPPKIGIFNDPITNTYGIFKIK